MWTTNERNLNKLQKWIETKFRSCPEQTSAVYEIIAFPYVGRNQVQI